MAAEWQQATRGRAAGLVELRGALMREHSL